MTPLNNILIATLLYLRITPPLLRTHTRTCTCVRASLTLWRTRPLFCARVIAECHTATHCNTPHHTATHCNTMHCTVTHCITPFLHVTQIHASTKSYHSFMRKCLAKAIPSYQRRPSFPRKREGNVRFPTNLHGVRHSARLKSS